MSYITISPLNPIYFFWEKQKSDGSASNMGSDDGSGTPRKHTRCDTTAATFLDIAVLRCLFITSWQEEGVHWCLHYIYNR